MEKIKFLKIILIFFSLFFLFQSISRIFLIPLRPLLIFLGRTGDPFKLLSAGIIAIVSIFIVAAVSELLYSVGFKRKYLTSWQKVFFAQGVMTFITVWLTFFSYGLFWAFGVFPKSIDAQIIFNLYLFWFLLLNAFNLRSGLAGQETTANQRGDIMEVNRITWLGRILDINKISSFKEEKGKILYQQPKKINIFFLILAFVITGFLSPLLYITGAGLFLPISPPEAALVLRLVFGLFFCLISFIIIYFLGLSLNRGVVVCENCLGLPLPVFLKAPLFTELLPGSFIFLSYKDVFSYSLKIKNSRLTLKVVLHSGGFINVDLTGFSDEEGNNLKKILGFLKIKEV